jgi:hypothetical protein
LRVYLEKSPTVRDVGNGQPGWPCHGLVEVEFSKTTALVPETDGSI